MLILGVDPGYAIVGIGLVSYDSYRFKALHYGAITTPADVSFDRRLEIIYDDFTAILEKYRPEAIAVERLYFTTNQKTVINVAQARGVLLLAAVKQAVPVYEYTPLQVKQAVVGYGKAEKHQIMEMTRRLLNLDSIPRPDDAADALAMAICHGHSAYSSLGNIGRRQQQ